MLNGPTLSFGPQGSGDRIRILIVDDVADTRDSIRKLLSFERDIEVIGESNSGEDAIQAARALQPDVILMDINMGGMDGIQATQMITTQVPSAQIIIMSVQSESEYMRRAMLAGARDFLPKPPSLDELIGTVRQVYQRRPQGSMSVNPTMQMPQTGSMPVPTGFMPSPGMGTMPAVGTNLFQTISAPANKLIAVFSPKGGTGCSTIAVNMAITMKQRMNKSVVLVDGNLPFGDVVVMLNLPKQKTIYDAIPSDNTVVDLELLDQLLVTHPGSNLPVLLSPTKPEMAEYVTPDVLKQVLTLLRSRYDYVIVDTQSTFSDASLQILDMADTILTPVTLELTTVKNVALFLELLPTLKYNPEKISLVVNRNDGLGGIRVTDVEAQLKQKVVAEIPSDPRLVTFSINQGAPLAMTNRESPVARAILKLAQVVTGETGAAESAQLKAAAAVKQPEKQVGLLGRLSLGKR